MRFKLLSLILFFFSLFLTACATPKEDLTKTPEETPFLESADVIKVTLTPTEEKNQGKPTRSIVVDQASLDGTQILFWHHWRGETTSILEELTMKFNRENSYKVEVIVESKGSSLYSEVRQGLNTGQYPNIVLAPMEDLLAWQHTRNILVNLNDYIRDPKHGLSGEDIDDFEPMLWDQDDKNGFRLGIPGLATSSLLASRHTSSVHQPSLRSGCGINNGHRR